MTPDRLLREAVDLLERRYLPLRATVTATPGMVHEDTEEGPAFQFDERFLQALWNEQRLAGDLRTLAGDELEVMSPGTWNVEPGPDFRNASIRIGGRAQCGDIEVHRHAEDWRHHGHHVDPLYRSVVLHVVWERPRPESAASTPPVFVLGEYLERPWQVLLDEIRVDIYPYARRVAPGRCAVTWALTDNARLRRLLRVAGLARFTDKAARLQRSAILKGFDQALYEHLFEALGYKANRVPFRRLAEAVPLSDLRDLPEAGTREAALFGAAALIPDPTVVPLAGAARDRARQLWDRWWPLGRRPLGLAWVRAATRPHNRPERRLAAGVALLERCQLRPCRWIDECAEAAVDPVSLLRRLQHDLLVPAGAADERPGGATAKRRPAANLGVERAQEAIVNVVLPFLAARGRHLGKPAWTDLAMAAYLRVPVLPGNRPLAEVVHRLLVPPSREREVLRTACEQQGLLGVYRDFCGALHNDCAICPLRTGVAVEPEPEQVTVTAGPM